MKPSRYLTSLSTIISTLLIILTCYLFLSGAMLRFYASIVFGFYALTRRMWISVVLLGVFQTLVLIPLRIFRLQRQTNLKEFIAQVKKQQLTTNQIKYLKTHAHAGNRIFLFYVVDFLIQLTTFLTIGRLFLKDFYSTHLDPKLLYSFIPYPHYPIRDTFFKIPYPRAAETTNLGIVALLAVWAIIMFIQLLFYYIKSNSLKKKVALPRSLDRITLIITTSTLIFFIISAIIVTHFPTQIELAIFSGDISRPNRTFNTLTAIVTFITMFWFNLNRIDRQSQAAEKAGLDEKVIHTTEQKLFNQALRDSALVGLGAYFITNHIPSAFELSVFTLELISLTSPFTLDPIILKASQRLTPPAPEKKPATSTD